MLELTEDVMRVSAPGDGFASGVAVVGQIIVSVVGMILGFGTVILGALLVLGRFAGQTQVTIELLGATFQVDTGISGVVFAVLGAVFAYISRFDIELTG